MHDHVIGRGSSSTPLRRGRWWWSLAVLLTVHLFCCGAAASANHHAVVPSNAPHPHPSQDDSSPTVLDYDNSWVVRGYTGEGITNGNLSLYISYSLYGNSDRYTARLNANIVAASILYQGWRIRLYHSPDVPERTISSARAVAETHAIPFETVVRDHSYYTKKGDFEGTFWRFEIADDESVDAFIVRDVDSLPTVRERAAVYQWLASPYGFHSMYDHPYHRGWPVLAGMWGAKRSVFPRTFNMHDLADKWVKSPKGTDQTFIKDKIWPLVRDKALLHAGNLCLDNRHAGKHGSAVFGTVGALAMPFPTVRYRGRFVGAVGRAEMGEEKLGAYQRC